jgi:hypothetical protein
MASSGGWRIGHVERDAFRRPVIVTWISLEREAMTDKDSSSAYRLPALRIVR